MNPDRADYVRFIISTQTNYTQTYFADHSRHFSHDSINRYLREDCITPCSIWPIIKKRINFSQKGYIIFDDTVLDKRHSFNIQLVHRQYSGNEHGLVKGIGVVNCLYVNPETKEYWIIDWRIYDSDTDGKSKIDHVMDMLDHALQHKKIPFQTVLVDSWYGSKELLLHIEKAKKHYYLPLKCNRNVDDSGGQEGYRRVDQLLWNYSEREHGKLVKLKGFPKDHKVKLLRVEATNRTEFIVTNDLSQNSTIETGKTCAIRWDIEQYHREVKQTLGIENCQCRLARAQKNHIACVVLAWTVFTEQARKLKTNIYALKKELLSDYMRTQLETLSVPDLSY